MRSLYDDNAYDLILSQIKKQNQKPLQIDLNMDLNMSVEKISTVTFQVECPSNLLEFHHPRKFLYHYVRYISSPILAVILHKLHHKKI